jgi:hypothetical protein
MRTNARCTDNAHDVPLMHVARATRACLAHRERGARSHRQLKALLSSSQMGMHFALTE